MLVHIAGRRMLVWATDGCLHGACLCLACGCIGSRFRVHVSFRFVLCTKDGDAEKQVPTITSTHSVLSVWHLGMYEREMCCSYCLLETVRCQ